MPLKAIIIVTIIGNLEVLNGAMWPLSLKNKRPNNKNTGKYLYCGVMRKNNVNENANNSMVKFCENSKNGLFKHLKMNTRFNTEMPMYIMKFNGISL